MNPKPSRVARVNLGSADVPVLVGITGAAVLIIVGFPLPLLVAGLGIATLAIQGRRMLFGAMTAIATVLMLLAAGSEMANPPPTGVQAPVDTAASARPVSAAPPVVVPVPAAKPSSTTTLMVIEVIEGDTFKVSDGATIGVLGIDSCESGTAGGQEAMADARRHLLGQSVSLRAEQGADRDNRGRLLRYVSTSNLEFAVAMVAAPHTSVDEGHKRASSAYMNMLRLADVDGRDCAGASAAPFVPRPNLGNGDDHHRRYINPPRVNSNKKSGGGNQSRFCRRSRFC